MLMLNLLNRPWFHHLSPHRRNIPTLGTHKANQILTRQEQVGIPEKDLSRCRRRNNSHPNISTGIQGVWSQH